MTILNTNLIKYSKVKDISIYEYKGRTYVVNNHDSNIEQQQRHFAVMWMIDNGYEEKYRIYNEGDYENECNSNSTKSR